MFYYIDDIILLMLKLASNKIDTYLTSSWRHQRYWVFCISWNFTHDISTVFEEIKHLRSRAPENIFYQIIKIDKTQILLKGGFFLFHEVLNFLKNDVNMFIYSKRLDDVWIFEKQSLSWKTMVCRQLYTNVR